MSDGLYLRYIDEILAKARDLNAFQRPSKRDYRSFRRWFWNKKPLSFAREEEFIKRKEDLVTLRHGREWAGFDGLIEEVVRKIPCRLTRVRNKAFGVYVCTELTYSYSGSS